MSSLFIAGNGFDIAHGIPSKYSDFRACLIDAYPEALKLRDEKVFLEDFNDIDPYEFAAEILLNTMDKAAGENWWNFEEALAYVSFDNKLPRPNHKENETEDEDRELMTHYLLYMDKLTNGFINCSKIWQVFFRLWIKELQRRIDNNEFRKRDALNTIISDNDIQFLTFNYTKTLQKLYGVKKVIHIHNRVGQNLIFGHGKENAMYSPLVDSIEDGPCIGSSFLDDMIMSFKKDTSSALNKYHDFFKKLNDNVDKVYSYGFGYGSVDSVYIKRILKMISPDATWFFTKYESLDARALKIKKIKLRRYGFKGKFDLFEG